MKNICILFIILILSCNFAIADKTFDIEVEVPKTYEIVKPGETVWFTTKLINLANDKRSDVTLTYNIIDKDNNIIASKSETVAVETQASFVSNIKLPENVEQGTFMIRATSDPLDSKFGTSHSEINFDVLYGAEKQFNLYNELKKDFFYGLTALIIIFFGFMIFKKTKIYLDKKAIQLKVKHIIKRRGMLK